MALNKVVADPENYKPVKNRQIGEGIEFNKRKFVESIEEIKVSHEQIINILHQHELGDEITKSIKLFNPYGESLAKAYEQLTKQGDV